MTRDWISIKIARHLNLRKETNINAAELHNIKICTCDRGNIGREKKKEANEERRKFYKTEKCIAIKKMYKERMRLKKILLLQLLTMNMRKTFHKAAI